MTLITAQDLTNLKTDADNIAAFANEDVEVTARLGGTYKSLRRLVDLIEVSLPALNYATETALLATTPTVAQLGYAQDTNRYFSYNGSVWTPTISVKDLSDALDFFIKTQKVGKNENFRSSFDAGFLNKSTGAVSNVGTSGAWSYLDFTPVFEETLLNKNYTGDGSNDANGSGLVLYDENKQFLQYYNFVEGLQKDLRIGDINADARYLRIGILQSNDGIVDFNIYNPIASDAIAGIADIEKEIRFLKEQQNYFIGDTSNYFTNLETGFYDQSGGEGAVGAYFRTKDFTPVRSDSVLIRDGFVGATTSVGFLTFYDANFNFLGFYNNSSTTEEILISDRETALALTAGSIKFVKMSSTSTSDILQIKNFIKVPVLDQLGEYENLFSNLDNEFNVDFFENDFTEGWIGSGTGVLTNASTWHTTPFAAVVAGDTFEYNLQAGLSTNVASISLWDEDFNFLGADFVGTSNFGTASGTYTTPADVGGTPVAYLRATSPVSYTAREFKGFKRQTNANDFATNPSFFIPDEIYAVVNEPLDLYLRGIMPDRAFELTSNISEVMDIAGSYTPTTTSDFTAEFKARTNDDKIKTLGTSVIKSASAPISPTGDERNVIFFGDSLVEGIVGATGVASDAAGSTQGASTNEIARILTGSGTDILNNAYTRPSYNLSNIRILGTRGDLTQPHEGRAGWSITNYKDDVSVSGVTNAFNNTGANGFSLNHYLTQVTHNVNATGSNLTVIIALGWNDSGFETADITSTKLDQLIDLMKAEKADVDIIIVGMAATPALVQKTHTGTRFVSERETFETQIKSYGQAFKDVAATKTNTEFLQISHVCNPEVMYPRTDVQYSQRSALVLENIETDYVHPDRIGYAIKADAIANKLIHKYCQ